jgi:hypothetical protein
MSGWGAGRGFRAAERDWLCAQCAAILPTPGRLCRRCTTRLIAKSAAAFTVVTVTLAMGYLKYSGALQSNAHVVVREQNEVAPVVELGSIGGWVYYQTQDTLVKDVTHHARLTGRIASVIDAPPAPKHGPAKAAPAHVTEPHAKGPPPIQPTLALAASAQYGKRIVLTLPRDVTTCGREKCPVLLAYDDAKPEASLFLDISSERETVLESDDYRQIVPRLAHTHALTVIVPQLNRPDAAVVFVVDGLKMDLVQ